MSSRRDAQMALLKLLSEPTSDSRNYLASRLEQALHDIEELKIRIALLEDRPRIPEQPIIPPMEPPVLIPLIPIQQQNWFDNPVIYGQTFTTDRTHPLEVTSGKTD